MTPTSLARNVKTVGKSPRERILFCLAISALAFAPLNQIRAAGKAEHVVVMVWDGLRPDFIRARYTPALRHLADQGVFFSHHHSVYVTSTEVNATALFTGVFPSRSTIVANHEYRPAIEIHETIETQDPKSVERGDKLTGGHYIAVPTLAEMVQAAGDRTATVCTKSVGFLLDRSKRRDSEASADSVNFFRGHVLPASAMPTLVEANEGKAFPSEVTLPNIEQDTWTTRALSKGLWKNGVPKLSILWMSDPDYTQHKYGPGSKRAIAALASADKNLAAILKALEEKGVRHKTDVFVVSDHGFSSIERNIDILQALHDAGFNAAKTFTDPKPGDILVVPLGGSVELYVAQHDETVIRRLVEYFQSTDFAGVILSEVPIEGTFPPRALRLNSPDAADLVVSLRWTDARSEDGTRGLLPFSGGKSDKGTHSSLSRYDLHNSLVAAGPDFRSGFKSRLPSGNLDLAPTISWILGLKAERKMDGRVLAEALVSPPVAPETKAEQKRIEATHESSQFRWRQYLTESIVGSAVYVDEGNGRSAAK